MPGPVAEEVATARKKKHQDDLQDSARYGENVAIEGRESNFLQREGQVCLNRRGWDVGNEADEIKTPHARITPGLQDVAEFGGLFQSRQPFGRVITQYAVGHDDFLALGVPGTPPNHTCCICWRSREIEVRNEADDECQKTFEKEEPKPARLPTHATHLKDACCQEGGDDAGDVQCRPKEGETQRELVRLVEVRREQDRPRYEATFAGANESPSDVEADSIDHEGLGP